jgi:hypothetical protein
MRPIDPSNPETWPPHVAALVNNLTAQATELVGSLADQPACDLPGSIGYDRSEEWQERFDSAVGDQPVLAYHATRLLRHEADWIRRDGLQILTQELIERRVTTAARLLPDLIDTSIAYGLQTTGPLGWQRGAIREGLIHVFTPLDLVDATPYGFDHLLGEWGGEAIARTNGDGTIKAAIRAISAYATPTIVEAAVHVTDFEWFAGLWPVFVGRNANMDYAAKEQPLHHPVPADGILTLISPDHPRWPDNAPHF